MLSSFIKIEDKDQFYKVGNNFSMIDTLRFMTWFDFGQILSFAIKIKSYKRNSIFDSTEMLKLNIKIKDDSYEWKYKNREII
jgi:hypothetical protein